MEHWYRVEDVRTASGPSYHVRKIPVLRHTPKGVWLADWPEKRFVLRNARKRYACPTEAEAMESFIARKQRQEKILRHQLDNVRRLLDAVGAKPITPPWEILYGRDPLQ